MHRFSYSDKHCLEQSLFYLRGEDDEIDNNNNNGGSCVADVADNEIHLLDSADLTTLCWMYNGMKASNASVMSANSGIPIPIPIPNSFGSAETGSSAVAIDKEQYFIMSGTGSGSGGGDGRNDHFDNWGDSAHLMTHHKETPTSATDHTNNLPQLAGERLIAGDSISTQQSKPRIRDPKELVKLAQNREAARKSRIRKKAYLQQLEKSQQRLTHLDQALRRPRHHQVASGILRHSVGGRGFEGDHAHWLGEHGRLMDDLRSALSCDAGEDELHLLVDEVFSHYGKFFRMKNAGARSDMFHILSGIWRTPVERCLMWLGGFRSSDLLKVLEKQIQPLSEQQLVGICNLQKSCQQTEDALSQGMEALQQSVIDTLSSSCLARHVAGNVVDYASQMALAMTNIDTIGVFLNQADLLRLNTLQQLQRILTTRQAARALLAINDYKSRLRALSSLWLARPME